jgi:hypothetical protein
MLMGLWLHFVYLTTRSLLLPILLHTLNNSLAVVISRVPGLQFIDSDAGDIPLLVYVSAALLLAAVAYALYQSRARLAPTAPHEPLLWQPAFSGVEYPPDDSDTQVVHPLPSPLALTMVGGTFVLFLVMCVGWANGS